MKPYRLGLLVGRFQTLHTGHEMMIETALKICDKVGILIGSSQESGTAKNPFSYELRAELLHTVFGDAVTVCPLPDIGVGNTALWGNYVLKTAIEQFGEKPDLLVSGKESRRVEWFGDEDGKSVAELYIPKTVDISASVMREAFITDNFAAWKKYTNPKLWERYSELRQIVLDSKDCLETKSI